ncbi:MAG TPA: hypothetical protein PLL53_06010 [Saprospiraceae bacterium]|nr:hypothetical protein [Saprospiraceae bacterium]
MIHPFLGLLIAAMFCSAIGVISAIPIGGWAGKNLLGESEFKQSG